MFCLLVVNCRVCPQKNVCSFKLFDTTILLKICPEIVFWDDCLFFLSTGRFFEAEHSHRIHVMYGIFTHIWLIFMVNVGKYTIHGCYGI